MLSVVVNTPCGVKVVTHFSYGDAFGSAARPLSLYGRTTPQFGYPNRLEDSRRTEMKTGVAESNHDGLEPPWPRHQGQPRARGSRILSAHVRSP
jgi:hypothetical protein